MACEIENKALSNWQEIENFIWGRSSVGSSKQMACEIENKALSNWQEIENFIWGRSSVG